jgi:multicomponent K+:H+ antiporter subunit G
MIADLVISLLLVIGGGFGLIGSLGLLKLRQPMQRLHAPTKATVLDAPSWQELLIMVFLFITSPITANFLSKAHLHRTIPAGSLPETGTDSPWATLDTEDADERRDAGGRAP